ncbi:MAG: OmpH family outer membrane protein [Muribaculaceae bacterium]|nr:OmpH family outer membrane protein [Muribaculaceae bacterium]MDE6553217.1 OmpH family outer membrane protein [Muribaculaceae bacterium]
MKRNLYTVLGLALAFSAGVGMSSCGGSKEEKAAPAAKVAASDSLTLPNYRYVDMDTLLTRYILAKDYNEEMIRMQNNLESETKKHQTSLQSLASQIQNKVQNNSYLSQESFDTDQQKLASMQSNAERSVGMMQQKYAEAAAKAQQAVADSVTAFIEMYNKKHGYDAIFNKAAALHFNPALDITDEIVEGLNARYNKIKK